MIRPRSPSRAAGSRAPLLEADVHSLPFPHHRFDLTVAVRVCEFAADPSAVVAELVRVTRPGGRIVIGSLQRSSPWGWWNRRQFHEPPWDTARFLDRDELERIAHRYGALQWRRGLYAPTALPGIARWGGLVERAGRIVAPCRAAFAVLTITLRGDPAEVSPARSDA